MRFRYTVYQDTFPKSAIFAIEEVESGYFAQWMGQFEVQEYLRESSTGMYDKNGDEVFEGDMLSSPDTKSRFMVIENGLSILEEDASVGKTKVWKRGPAPGLNRHLVSLCRIIGQLDRVTFGDYVYYKERKAR